MQDKISIEEQIEQTQEKMDEGVDDTIEMSLKKLEQAQQKMDRNDYAAAIPILLEAAEFDPSNYLILYALMTCYLNIDFSYYIRTKNRYLPDTFGKSHEACYEASPTFSKVYTVITYLTKDKKWVAFSATPVTNYAMSQLTWIKNLDLSETLPRDELLINQTLTRSWMALCIAGGHSKKAIATFEKCSSFHEQFGWRELCSIADCYSMYPESSNKAIALYKQAYQKNPHMDIAYHVSWATAYRALENWDEVFKQLKIMAAKDMYDPGLRNLLNSLLKKDYTKLEDKFFPELKKKPRTYHAVFWDVYFFKKIAKAKKEFSTCKEGLPAFTEDMLQELNSAFGSHPAFPYYLHRADLLSLNGKEAMDDISQAIDLINVDFMLTITKSWNAYINVILSAYTKYEILCENKPGEDFTVKEAFNVAYGIPFLYAYPPIRQKLVLQDKIPVAHQILYFNSAKDYWWQQVFDPNLSDSGIEKIPLVKEMFPVAQEILHLRLARATEWQDNHAPGSYNFRTAQINALLDENKIIGQTNRAINWPSSLFVKAARTVRETHQRLPAECPPEMIARYRAVKDYPMGVELSEEEPESQCCVMK